MLLLSPGSSAASFLLLPRRINPSPKICFSCAHRCGQSQQLQGHQCCGDTNPILADSQGKFVLKIPLLPLLLHLPGLEPPRCPQGSSWRRVALLGWVRVLIKVIMGWVRLLITVVKVVWVVLVSLVSVLLYQETSGLESWNCSGWKSSLRSSFPPVSPSAKSTRLLNPSALGRVCLKFPCNFCQFPVNNLFSWFLVPGTSHHRGGSLGTGRVSLCPLQSLQG